MPISNPVWLSLTSNPVWRAKSFITHIGEARAATRWDYNSAGYASPSNGRELGSGELEEMNQYNSQRGSLNLDNIKALDAVISRFLPLSDVLYHPLDGIRLTTMPDTISWLHDHPMGGNFYNDPANFGMNPDETADIYIGIFQNFLKKTGINVDISEVIEKVSNGISTPIVINLDGSGITTTSFIAGKQVFFDIDGDGVKEKTAWISGNNAFLVIDTNGDGVINLFGGKNRADGFTKLAELDSNGDEKIDKNDDRFLELLLWQDKNMDGVMDEDELTPAWKAGLESISLNYSTQDVWQNGNLLGEVSSAIYQGRKVEVADVYFRFRNNSELNLVDDSEAAMHNQKPDDKNSSNTNCAESQIELIGGSNKNTGLIISEIMDCAM